MKRYGLVGYPLEHSFSKNFFTDKFGKMGISNSHVYELFEMEFLKDFPSLWSRYSDLEGINITVPHKLNIKEFLDFRDYSAIKVEAVNVVKRKGTKLTGYNTDYPAFKESLENWLGDDRPDALVLGAGGASRAVQAALDDLGIAYEIVSRRKDNADMLYTQLFKDESIMQENELIINTTPVGMFPRVKDGPPIPYELLGSHHRVYDLIYNPEKTLLMEEAEKAGGQTKNGHEMLVLQAEKAWEIWNDPDK